MRTLLVILFLAFSSILLSQSKITLVEYHDTIDSFQVGDKIISPGSFSQNICKTIFIPVKSDIILRIYDNSTNKMISEYFNDTLEYGKYLIDFEEVSVNMKSGIYRIELNASIAERQDIFPEKVITERKFVFIR